MFEASTFRSSCLVPNKIDFVFSCPKCINLLSANQSHKLEKSLSSCFSISVIFLYWKTMQVSFAKKMNHWQQLGASHLYKKQSLGSLGNATY